jgi:hypothetical protein
MTNDIVEGDGVELTAASVILQTQVRGRRHRKIPLSLAESSG